jgi:beta-glucosidase
MRLTFPDRFLFGAATSATQIEGGAVASDWSTFARRPGATRDGGTPETACDHWGRWRDDVELVRRLGLGAYRMSLEWARIEPEAHRFDADVVERYRQELGALRDAGIVPMVTLLHFTLPRWLAERGGVASHTFPMRFERYATHVVEALGDLVPLWITVNEPNVQVAQGYVFGVWPPGERSLPRAASALHHMLDGHVRAYRALHAEASRHGWACEVGVANHQRPIEPARDTLAYRLAARAADRIFNEPFARALCGDAPYGRGDVLAARLSSFDPKEAIGTHDFFGLNYYSRDKVRPGFRYSSELYLHRDVAPGAEVTDLGWEIHPEGLGQEIREWAGRSRKPVYVTENGLADALDAKRPAFIRAHLAQVARALAEGIDVRGYFHWSLLDNFEWAEGYGPRFGLYEVDYATQERRARPSAEVYARIARERAVEP